MLTSNSAASLGHSEGTMEGLKDPEQFSQKQFTFLGSILPMKDGAVAFFGGGCQVPAAASGAPSQACAVTC